MFAHKRSTRLNKLLKSVYLAENSLVLEVFSIKTMSKLEFFMLCCLNNSLTLRLTWFRSTARGNSFLLVIIPILAALQVLAIKKTLKYSPENCLAFSTWLKPTLRSNRCAEPSLSVSAILNRESCTAFGASRSYHRAASTSFHPH